MQPRLCFNSCGCVLTAVAAFYTAVAMFYTAVAMFYTAVAAFYIKMIIFYEIIYLLERQTQRFNKQM